MTLQQMRYLVEISKSGSINKAAQNLYTSQPSLSKAISNLEEELGISTFEREGRTVRFTPEGAELLGYAKQYIELETLVKNHFANKKEETPIRLSVSSQHYSFTTRAFARFVNTLGDRSCELHLWEGKTSKVIDDVYRQKSTIGIIYLSSSTERLMLRILHEKGIVFHPLKSFTPHIFIGRHHPLASSTSVTLPQLEAYPCISYEQGYDSLSFSEEIVSVDPHHQIIYVSDRQSTNSLLRNTNCYNIGTGGLLPDFIDEEIITIPLSDYHDQMNIGWIILKDRVVPPEVEQYIGYLQESLDLCVYGHSS